MQCSWVGRESTVGRESRGDHAKPRGKTQGPCVPFLGSSLKNLCGWSWPSLGRGQSLAGFPGGGVWTKATSRPGAAVMFPIISGSLDIGYQRAPYVTNTLKTSLSAVANNFNQTKLDWIKMPTFNKNSTPGWPGAWQGKEREGDATQKTWDHRFPFWAAA